MGKLTNKYSIVQIVWEDIFSPDGGWIRPEKANEELKPCLITSVGYLIAENPDYILYASDLADDGTANGVTQIPRSNVKSVKVLRKARQNAKEANVSA